MIEGLDPKHLLEKVVRPVLAELALGGLPAEQLVMGTAAQESRLKWLTQLGNGPARGLWQMEPATHDDIWKNFLAFKPALAATIRGLLSAKNQGAVPDSDELVGNLFYAAAMCRIHYRRSPSPIPLNLQSQAALWKIAYNSPKGKGTVEEYVANWAIVQPAFTP